MKVPTQFSICNIRHPQITFPLDLQQRISACWYLWLMLLSFNALYSNFLTQSCINWENISKSQYFCTASISTEYLFSFCSFSKLSVLETPHFNLCCIRLKMIFILCGFWVLSLNMLCLFTGNAKIKRWVQLTLSHNWWVPSARTNTTHLLQLPQCPMCRVPTVSGHTHGPSIHQPQFLPCQCWTYKLGSGTYIF